MSKDNSENQGVLDRFNPGSIKSIFILFSIVLVSVSTLFFVFVEYDKKVHNEKLIEKLSFKNELAQYNNLLESEVQNALKSSLLFSISNKEIDRFQAIYSLKMAKKIFTDYQQKARSLEDDESIKTDIQTLNEVIAIFSRQVTSTLNEDGKLAEILSKSTDEADSLTDVIIVEESMAMDVSKAKEMESVFNDIHDQLFVLGNHISMTLDDEISELSAKSSVGRYVVFALIIVVLLLILGYLIVDKLNSSVKQFSGVLDDIAKGELPEEEINSEREFEQIVSASNQLVKYLDDASQFATKIGDGDFGYEFKPKSQDDALGNSLIDMRDRLQEVAREDKVRNWINEGQAKFGEILRQHSDNINVLGTKVVSNIVEYLGASQGALFVLKEEGENQYLELLSAYANKREKHIEKKIEVGEGLAGQAFKEGKTIYLTDIKTDHYDIKTGLGTSRPTSLLIVPLKEEERIEGIIEIASLKEIDKNQIEFIESIGESIASSLNAGKVNQTTKKLLADTQEKAEEMRAQEEELRQNMEELAATQEQMERRNKEMVEIQQKLTEEKYLLNALLGSTNDRIYFKDKESKFIRVSKSMTELFEKEDEGEIIGKSDFDFGFEEHAKIAFEDEQKIIRTATPMIDVVEKETWDDGSLTWVSTTKNPLRDLEGNIVGTFGISRDVTKNKLMELGMIKRKNWFDNFFKFHTTGFVVLEKDGKVDFATEGILSQLGRDDFSELVFEDIFIDKSFDKVLLEIDFENKKDKEIQLELVLNNESKTKIKMLVFAGSQENEDGSQNIYLIQQ